uniref:Uncharacterized protein n=1 Tax=Hyaloperonospora arabidopsidis (strain Emoy2) TaxID=559515 RepID=M4BWU4_HYAAE
MTAHAPYGGLRRMKRFRSFIGRKLLNCFTKLTARRSYSNETNDVDLCRILHTMSLMARPRKCIRCLSLNNC